MKYKRELSKNIFWRIFPGVLLLCSGLSAQVIFDDLGTQEIDGKIFYEISNAEELTVFRDYLNDPSNLTDNRCGINAVLTADIDLSAGVVYDPKENCWAVGGGECLELEFETDVESGEDVPKDLIKWEPFNPINGADGGASCAYSGIFDGNNFSISGFYIDLTGNSLMGFFGSKIQGEVKNLTLKSAAGVTRSSVMGGSVGFFAAELEGKLTNVHFEGIMTNSNSGLKVAAGGIVGTVELGAEIDSASVKGFFESDTVFAGIAIYNNGSISGAQVSGELYTTSNGYYSMLAGVAYENTGIISGARVSGKLSSNSYLGGVVYNNEYPGTISDAVVDAILSAAKTLGGIAHTNTRGVISNVETKGTFSLQYGATLMGGVVGSVSQGGSIQNAVNRADLDASSAGEAIIGGIVGEVTFNYSLENVSNEGILTGKGVIGGLVGLVSGGQLSVIDGQNSGDIEIPNMGSASSVAVGGCVGYILESSGIFERCINSGKFNLSSVGVDMDLDIYVGGLVGYYTNRDTATVALRITDSQNESGLNLNFSNVSDSVKTYSGGLVGYVSLNNPYYSTLFSIENSSHTGDISVIGNESVDGSVGGLIGYLYTDQGNESISVSVQGNLVEGVLTESGELIVVGGLIGFGHNYAADWSIKSNYFKGNISVAENTTAGGLLGMLETDGQMVVIASNIFQSAKNIPDVCLLNPYIEGGYGNVGLENNFCIVPEEVKTTLYVKDDFLGGINVGVNYLLSGDVLYTSDDGTIQETAKEEGVELRQTAWLLSQDLDSETEVLWSVDESAGALVFVSETFKQIYRVEFTTFVKVDDYEHYFETLFTKYTDASGFLSSVPEAKDYYKHSDPENPRGEAVWYNESTYALFDSLEIISSDYYEFRLKLSLYQEIMYDFSELEKILDIQIEDLDDYSRLTRRYVYSLSETELPRPNLRPFGKRILGWEIKNCRSTGEEDYETELTFPCSDESSENAIENLPALFSGNITLAPVWDELFQAPVEAENGTIILVDMEGDTVWVNENTETGEKYFWIGVGEAFHVFAEPAPGYYLDSLFLYSDYEGGDTLLIGLNGLPLENLIEFGEWNYKFRAVFGASGSVEFRVAELTLQGQAFRYSVVPEYDFPADFELRMTLEKAGESVLDTVIPGVVSGVPYVWEYAPLAPGKYALSAELFKVGSEKPAASVTEDFEIDHTAFVIAATTSEWNLFSLGSGDFSDIKLSNEDYLYHWNEALIQGDYWQYERLYSLKNLSSTTAYWYFSENPQAISLEPVTAIQELSWDLDSVRTGWHLIANPYSWPVALPESDGLHFWGWNPVNGDFDTLAVIPAFGGAWVHVGGPQKLKIPAHPVFETEKEPLSKRTLSKVRHQKEWLLQLSLENSKGKQDAWNVIGVFNGLKDLPEPPSGPGSRVNLSLKKEKRALARDIRTAVAETGETWEMDLSSSIEERAQLKVAGIGELRRLGFRVIFTQGNYSQEISDDQGISVLLKPENSRATITVVTEENFTLASSFQTFRIRRLGAELAVYFEAPLVLSGKEVSLQLTDIHGRVQTHHVGTAMAGENQMMLKAPPTSGVYILHLSLGNRKISKPVHISQ